MDLQKEKLKHTKSNLSFTCSKVMRYLRTPPDIWQNLSKEFNFTIDCCASDQIIYYQDTIPKKIIV